MKRRDFLSWVGVGALAASLPMALAACNSGATTAESDQSTVAAGDGDSTNTAGTEIADSAGGFVPIGPVATLDDQGFIADEDFSAGPVMVIRNPDDPNGVIAVNSTCPHRGCIVEWAPADEQFQCPCHNSIFEPDGSFVSGPANNALDTFMAKVEGDQVLVRAM